MTAQPSSPVDRSEQPDRGPVVAAAGTAAPTAAGSGSAPAAVDVPAQSTSAGSDPAASAPRATWRDRFGHPPRGILLLGLTGAVLMALGGFGAGGVLVRDPVLTDSALGFWRYGHGREIATALVYLGVALIAWAWVRLGREVIARRVGGRAVLTTAAAWLGPVLLCPPLFTRDIFSYLAQGALPLAGLDPYAVGPEALPGIFTDNVHYFWQDTPAPYGPLFILYAKGVAWLAGDTIVLGVVLMRLALLPGLLLLVWAVPELTRRMGGRPALALWIAVANPMTIVHMVGGGHNDLLVVGLLAASALVALRGQHAGGIALATAAMAVKASAGIALPFLVLVWAATLPGSRLARTLRAGVYGIAVFVPVFALCTVAAGVGLGWLPALSAPSMIVNWLSPPTALGQLTHTLVNLVWPVPMQPFVNVARAIGATVLLVVAVRQWWAARDGGPDALRRAGIVLIAVALLSPTTLPWYLSWGIALLAMVDWTERGLQLMVFVSLFLLVVYYPDGEAALYDLLVLGVGIALAALATVSLVRPDPLGLRRATPVEHARAAR